MSVAGGKDRGDRGPIRLDTRASAQDRVGKQIEQYVDLLRKQAPTEKIKQAEKQLSEQMGKDRFEAFKRQLPRQLRARRSLDAQRVYRQFRLPGRRRMVRDRRGRMRGRPAAKLRARKAAARSSKEAAKAKVDTMRMRGGRITKQASRKYKNFFADKMQLKSEATARTVGKQAQIDELLSKFEKLIVRRFEHDQEVAKQSKKGEQTFLQKTESQWKTFFARFTSRFLKKKVPTKNIQDFLFRGMVSKGAKGVVISDMTLASGRVERFVRFSILAEAMARLAKLMPGEKFGKDMLKGEELYYLALAAARGREYKTVPKPAEGRFMGGVAEERAAQELGLPMSAHLEHKSEAMKKGGRMGAAFAYGEDKERPPEEQAYRFVPWWHWGNLKRPCKFKMMTVAFYLALLLLAIIGITAISAMFLR